MAISKLEDAEGKWYVDLFGRRNTHTFILEHLEEDAWQHDLSHGWYIGITMHRTLLTYIQRDIQKRFLEDPVTATADIEKLNRKLISKIFKYGVH